LLHRAPAGWVSDTLIVPRLVFVLLLLSSFGVSPALAGDRPSVEERDAAKKARKEARLARQTDPRRLETGLFPGAAYDSNLGFGTGIVGNLAKLDPDFDPYKWRLAAQIFLYFDGGADGLPEITYVHNYADLDLPGLIGGRLRVRSRVWFRRQIDTGWYGLGNESVASQPWEDLEEGSEAYVVARRFHEYDAIEAGGRSFVRALLAEDLEFFGGASIFWVWPTVYPESRLELDLAGGSGEATVHALVGAERHGVLEGVGGLLFDTRDSETDPERGVYTEFSVRGGPVFEANTGYFGVNAVGRLYIPVVPYYLTLGLRGLGDVLLGSPPFYELARTGGFWPIEALAGPMGVRGMRARRYHGKVKLLANLEARFRFFSLRVFGNHTTIGAVAFLDAGRTWADTAPHPELDGLAPGIKVGVGTGLRIRFGTTFMVRADFAWTSDGSGIYVDVDHVF
jgi:hypothetical protein